MSLEVVRAQRNALVRQVGRGRHEAVALEVVKSGILVNAVGVGSGRHLHADALYSKIKRL
jgi:hypothetical protein